MKTRIITLVCSIAALLHSHADDALEKNSDIVDTKLYGKATAVVRVWVKSSEGGSKYHWVNVLNHATIKQPKASKLPAEMRIAYYSFGRGLPEGFATLYLVRYGHKDWKLLEIFDPKTKTYSKGYSHHSKK